jgi:hypothetical protein
MKNVNDVLALLNKAVASNNEEKTWFFSYSGHVNLVDVRLYPEGWWAYDKEEEMGRAPKVVMKGGYIDQPESINELYYWIKFLLEGSI